MFVAYLNSFLTFFFTYLLPYLSAYLRINPILFQVGGPKRHPNLRFCIYFLLLYILMHGCMFAFVVLDLVSQY